jgi:hypothetical protein
MRRALILGALALMCMAYVARNFRKHRSAVEAGRGWEILASENAAAVVQDERRESLLGGSDGFDLPLYMFISTRGDGLVDIATLPSLEAVKHVALNASFDHTLLYDAPVGYISKTKTTIADKPLFAYWSASRSDWETNVVAPAAKDGYTPGLLLGYVASRPFSEKAPGSAPLFGYWNAKAMDNLCGTLVRLAQMSRELAC